MKATILIVFSIFALMSISCDNYEISDIQAESFMKFYGVGMKDEGMKVITTNDGYLIMGNVENPGRGKDICIIKTDKYGNSNQPVLTHGGLFEDYGRTIKANNNGYIIAGYTRTSENADKDVYLLQVSESGEYIWDSIYGRSGDDEAYGVLVLDNENIVITGYSESDDRIKEILFLETDPAGNIVNWNFIEDRPEDHVAFTIVKSGSKYMIAGYKNTEEVISTQPVRKIFVMRWTGDGPFDVNPAVNYIPEGTSSRVEAIIPVTNNEYYLACNVNELQTNTSSVYILKIDTLWNIQWQKSFGERDFNIISDFSIHDNSLCIGGTSVDNVVSANTNVKGDLWICKTSLTGENVQYYYSGDGASYIGKGFDHTADGGFIITGSNITGDNSIITLCKLNALGELH